MHESPIINLGGFHLDLSVLLMLIVTSAIVFIVAKLATRNLSVENPGKMQNFLEWAIEFVRNLISSTMDMKKGQHFLTLATTMIMFIFVGNMLGLPLGFVTGATDASQAEIFGKPIVSVKKHSMKLMRRIQKLIHISKLPGGNHLRLTFR